MPNYEINFIFEGTGKVTIPAKTRTEAKRKFNQGKYDTSKERKWGDEYEIDDVEPIKRLSSSKIRSTVFKR